MTIITKYLIASLGVLSTLYLKAQVEVNSKSFDLESINKHKGWYVVEAGLEDNTGNIFIKLGKPSCDIDKSIVGNTAYTTFNGMGWTIDKLIFSPSFQYKNNTSTTYRNTKEALLNNELVFGRNYLATPAGPATDAISGMAMPTRAINNSFMFSKIVVGTAGIGGFKIATSYISTQVTGQVTKTRGDVCGENPSVYKVNAIDAKDEKGQRWIPMYNNPVPNGGNILFNTVGVSADPNVQHYVFRKYDENGAVIKEKAFSFKYQCLPTMKEIEKTPGVYDYVLIMSPINYKKSKLGTAAPNQYEYIKINGETFEIIEQFTFTAPYSLWKMTYAIEDKGELYLAGVAGAKSNVYFDFSVPKPEDYPNFQLVKIANGKIEYVTAVTEKDMEANAKTIEGLKSKTPFHFHLNNAVAIVNNGRFYLSGQQELEIKRGSLILAVFGTNGTLESYLAKTSKEFARSKLSFNVNGSKLYWILEDLGIYNDILGTNTLSPKKAKEVISAIELVTYDVNQKQLIKYQSLLNEDWAINYRNPVLFESDTELLLLGNKITKKAKESEVVFITLKKL